MTLAEIKAHLGDLVSSPSNGEDRDAKWTRYFNQAAERIYNSGKWKGTVRTISVQVGSDGFIELPTTYETVLAVRNDHGTPFELFAESIEWRIDGPGGIGPVGSENGPAWGLIDRGDGTAAARRYRVPVSLADPLEEIQLRVKLAAPTFSFDDEAAVHPPNIGAWKMAMLALLYEDENDMERSDAYWGRCYALLNQELNNFRGKPKLTVSLSPWGLSRSGPVRPFY